MKTTASVGRAIRRDVDLACLAPLLAVALAFGLRLYLLQESSIWYDEGLTVWAARSRLIDMVHWTSADVHPPLYFVLVHCWRLLAGDSELAVRFVSVAVGTLCVAALWTLGRLLVPKQPWVATAGAALLALSRFSVWWSQEARMYELGALLCVLNFIFAMRLRHGFGRWDVLGYLAVTIAAFWTLYLLAFVLVIDGIYWLLGLLDLADWRRRVRALLGWAALELVAVAGIAPWLAYAVPRMRNWSNAEPPTPATFLDIYATLLSLGIPTNVDQVRLPTMLVAGVSLVGAILILLRRPAGPARSLILLLLAVALPPLVLWALMIVPRSVGYIPSVQARYLLPYAAGFSLLLAWAVAAIAGCFGRFRRPVAVALFLGLAGLEVWSLAGYYRDRLRTDDYVSIASTLQAHALPSDAVVLDTDETWPVFSYHWGRPFVGVPDGQKIDPGWVDRFLGPIWAGHDATWLVVNERALQSDPSHLLEDWLRSHAVASHEWRFGTRLVVVFARGPTRAGAADALAPGFHPPAPPRALTAGGLTLVGWEQPVARIQAGEVANLALDVRRDGPSGAGGPIAVQLGQPAVARVTAEVSPGPGARRITFSLLVPPGAPGGSLPWIVQLGDRQAIEGTLSVIPAPAAEAAPAAISPATRDDVTFGTPPLIRLVGHDAPATVSPGQSATVTLYWQDLQQVPASYKVFVHYLTPANRVAAQRDDFPVGGDRPTTSWRQGEVIVDRYQVPVEANVPPGSYTLEVGLYDPSTGQRLGPVLISDGQSQKDDRIVLGTVIVK